MSDAGLPDWEAKAQFMRRTGATSASWSHTAKGEVLARLELGPEPMPPEPEKAVPLPEDRPRERLVPIWPQMKGGSQLMKVVRDDGDE